MATRIRRKRRSRRAFVRPFLAAECRGDFAVLQSRLLGKYTPLGAVDTSAFEEMMAILWKRSFAADPRPRMGTGVRLALGGSESGYAELLPEYLTPPE